MLKNIHYLKKTIGFAFLLVSMTFTVVGCGSDSAPTPTPEVQSQNAMKEAFTYLEQVGNTNDSEQIKLDNLNKALDKTINSYDLYPNQDALLVKAFIEVGLNKFTDAENTLSKVDAEYPEHSEDEFIRAYLNAKENKDAAEVLKYLNLSMSNDFSGMGEELWWGFLDKLPAFANFRTTSEYTDLLNMKSAAKTVFSSTYVCTQNKTWYKTRWFGMEIGVSHDDKIKYLDNSLLAVQFFGMFTPPPVPLLLGTYAMGERIAINLAESVFGHGCGVKLNDTWLNMAIWIPTPQK